MAPDDNAWIPPVLFHFSVDFQWEDGNASASFSEVDGLSQELMFKEEGERTVFLTGVKVSDITLRRAIEPINEKITVWVKNTFQFMHGAKIKPCTLIISLLNEKNKIIARWICERAFPIRWTVNTLNASESRIALETITLRYKSLRRSK